MANYVTDTQALIKFMAGKRVINEEANSVPESSPEKMDTQRSRAMPLEMPFQQLLTQ